jgi:hypothetical protein
VGHDEDQRALAEYRRTHWGLGGVRRVRELLAPDPTAGTLVELGRLVSVVYETRKLGDLERTEYEHDFGPRGRPILAFNASGLVIVGGRYRVTTRGIVG